MKVVRIALFAALITLTVLAAPAGAATGKPNSPGKGNPYPPGQAGKCPTSEEHGGCPPGSKGKGNVRVFSSAAHAGQAFRAEGSGFKPASRVEAFVDGVAVEPIGTDRDGAFKAAVTVPSDAKPGPHTVRFKGTGVDDRVVDTRLPFVVTGPQLVRATRPSTGLTVGSALAVLLALGALATFRVRGRRVAAEGI